MRKIFVIVALSFGITSCLKNDKDVFGKASSERMEEAIEQAYDVLTSAPNGWEMSYYPEANRIYGGYTILLKFDKQNNVMASGENFITDYVAESKYEIVADNGPMLSFNTYNDVVHFYSDPAVGATGGIGTSNGGLEGDSDFYVQEATSAYVKLKGTKTGNYAILRPLSANTVWKEELDACKSAVLDMTLSNYTYEIGDESFKAVIASSVNKFTSRVLQIAVTTPVTLADGTESQELQTITAPFQYTKTGLRFYEPVQIRGTSVSEMTFTEGYYFVDAAGSGAKLMTPTPIHSDLQIGLSIDEVTFRSARMTAQPSNTEERYFVTGYKKSAEAGLRDKDIQRTLLRDLNNLTNTYTLDAIEAALLHKGDYTETLNSLILDTDYVIAAFGCKVDRERNIIVATTDLFKSYFSTEGLPEDVNPQYKSWLGSWVVTSTSSIISKTPLSFKVTIEPKVVDGTFIVSGWGTSILRDKAGYELEAVFDTTNGSFKFMNDQEVYSDSSDGSTVRLLAYANKVGTTDYTLVTGSFAALTATPDGVMVGATSETLNIVYMEYFSRSSSGSYSSYIAASGYTTNDYPIGPYTLIKEPSATSTSARAIEPLSLETAVTANRLSRKQPSKSSMQGVVPFR